MVSKGAYPKKSASEPWRCLSNKQQLTGEENQIFLAASRHDPPSVKAHPRRGFNPWRGMSLFSFGRKAACLSKPPRDSDHHRSGSYLCQVKLSPRQDHLRETADLRITHPHPDLREANPGSVYCPAECHGDGASNASKGNYKQVTVFIPKH